MVAYFKEVRPVAEVPLFVPSGQATHTRARAHTHTYTHTTVNLKVK